MLLSDKADDWDGFWELRPLQGHWTDPMQGWEMSSSLHWKTKENYSQNSASEWQLKAMLVQILPNHGQSPLNEPSSAASSVLSAP